MNNVAIIPARSGSKNVKDKNIRLMGEKPLIAYSIEAAQKSGMFTEVMVSTDSPVYAQVAETFGAQVPFLRSIENASDSASSWDMVLEVLQEYEKEGKSFDTFCLLQPTSPLRTADDIRQAYKLYEEKAKFAVVSVCEAEHSPLWSGQLPDSREFVNFIDVKNIRQRQAMGKFFRLNGAIYIANVGHFVRDQFLYQRGSYAYVMPQERSIDIDTELDFVIAEAILKNVGQTNI